MPLMRDSFADRLSGLMGTGRHRMTLDELGAVAAGRGRKAYSKQAASRWVNGSGIPDQECLANLADRFDVSKEWLFFGDSPKARIAIDIARGVDLLPHPEQQEVARDVGRRLEGVADVPVGPRHDAFMRTLKSVAEVLKKAAKPRTQ